MNRAVTLDRGVDRADAIVLARHVGGDGEQAIAAQLIASELGNVVCLLWIARRGDDDICAGGRQPQCDCAADSRPPPVTIATLPARLTVAKILVLRRPDGAAPPDPPCAR